MSWYYWVLVIALFYELVRYIGLTSDVEVDDFEIKWAKWLLCGFRPHRYVKHPGMFAYCKHCGVPIFAPDYRF